MPEYKNVQFSTNVPSTVQFQYDNPKTGTTRDIHWIRYSVKENGEVKSFLADEKLHKTLILAKVKKDTVAIITHKERSDDKKQKYWEVQVGQNVYTSDDLDSSRVANEIKQEEAERAYKPDADRLIDVIEENYIKVCKRPVLGKLSDELKLKVAISAYIQETRSGIKPPPKTDDAPEIDEESLPF
jgi:hypothetical protein